MDNVHFRERCALGFLACAGSIAFALYLQHAKGLDPCPMCIFQRVAMIACGAVFLLGALHGPKGRARWIYAVVAAMMALAGAGVAARQVWLQSLPPDQVPTCGPPLDYLLEIMPLRHAIAYVLKGEGSCARIDAQWLGIALPQWTLFGFILLALFALAMPLRWRMSWSGD